MPHRCSSPSWIDGTSASRRCYGDLINEEFLLGPVDLGGLVVIAPVHRAGDPGSNPSPGENFSLKLLILYITLQFKCTLAALGYYFH